MSQASQDSAHVAPVAAYRARSHAAHISRPVRSRRNAVASRCARRNTVAPSAAVAAVASVAGVSQDYRARVANEPPVAKPSSVRAALRALAENAHAPGDDDPLDEFRADVLATFDAGASAQKIADLMTDELKMPISKDKIWRYVRKHGAKRARAQRTDSPATTPTPGASDELAPRRRHRRATSTPVPPGGPHQPSAKSYEL